MSYNNPNLAIVKAVTEQHMSVSQAGRITLRFAGQMKYLGIGRAHTGTRTLTVITGNHALTTNTETGEIIAEHNIDTGRRYQPNLIKNTHPTQTQTPQS